MNFLSIIWSWFCGLFHVVAGTHPPTPELIDKHMASLPPPEAPLDEDVLPVEEKVPDDLEFKFLTPKSDRLTKDYTATDFACVDGTRVPAKYYHNMTKLAVNIQRLADALGKPVIVVDGFRTAEYNRHIGGNPKSQHLVCLGAEVKVRGMSRARLAAKIKELIKEGVLEKGGVAIYPNGVHYDVRGKNLSWGGKRNKK